MDLLLAHAPKDARGYRLFWANADGSETGYPRTDGKQWIAYTGRPAYARSFRLYPFEPPAVPHPGVYGVGFVGPRQVEIPPSGLLVGGVYVVPITV